MKINKLKAFTLIELLTVISIILILAGICIPVLGRVGFNQPAEGEKIGIIIKLNYQGFKYKTYEAELIRGGMNNGSGSFGAAPFHFTVPPFLVEQVKSSMDNQKEVKIYYRQKGVYNINTSDSGGDFP